MNNRIKISMKANLENQSLARALLCAYLVKYDPTVEEMTELKTALSEAMGNAIIHGYEKDDEREVILEIGTLNDREICIKVIDYGVGIKDVDRARIPLYSTLVGEECSGMGFTIMESFVDKVFVDSKLGEGTTVTLVKRLDSYGN